ncbi:hypothetical protein POX_e06830 [Penicillium oxalicum]|uniref:hypothetical protein n=1 Tax=Penicillium oxalicum TaxID=69781 RepID=UPI0020B8ECF3|nr:hypothetical protein POX_e06830 [Penicillium oxalicum]KAI2788809.1 hypothetical protein POX_e06830 [Penicillium oxalicum]
MGLNEAVGPIRDLHESLNTEGLPDWPGIAIFQNLYHSARIAAQDISLLSLADSLRSIYQDGTVNWNQLAVLSTFVITMVGWWLRKRSAKSPTKVLASSDDDYEDDDYDSNGSLRHGTEPHRQATEWSSQPQQQTSDAFKTDPGILRKFTTFSPYVTSIATYPAVRTFFCPHPNISRLPDKPTPLPLLVFVHGLGGSLAQFHHLLTSISNVGSCLGIDLPGCGLSRFAPTEWDAYTVEALAELVAVAIETHRDRENGQGVILVGHSLGCSLSALMASSESPIGKDLKQHILSMVAICPRASPPSEAETAKFRRLLSIPEPIFDLWRLWDRRGGIRSTSVMRMVSHDADEETRSLQVRFNKQSRTGVWRRMASGTLPEYKAGNPVGGLPGQKIWAAVQIPILLVAGEADSVTKPTEIEDLLRFFGDASVHTAMDTTGSSVIPDASRVHDRNPASPTSLADEEKFGLQPAGSEKTIEQPTSNQGSRKRIVKSAILPAPASHALLYDRATYRTLSGIIQDFLSQHIDKRLGLGWQLQYMNTSGKWDVKNLAKWQKVAPVSKPIANTFAAMKMLREIDDEHNPVLFSQKYRGRIHAVIDISHESPVYNPNTMEKGGVHYYKHPTVSKIPPTPDEARDFIALVDRLQREIDDLVEKRDDTSLPRPLVGVHCHYGYNRTGFLIACYLIERLGYGVQDAIDEFNRCRPPGIRHGHFVDTLFVRYCVGLKRAPTL